MKAQPEVRDRSSQAVGNAPAFGFNHRSVAEVASTLLAAHARILGRFKTNASAGSLEDPGPDLIGI